MLDYRLETFICVCKHLNYTKAAEELNITQPAVSQHIKFIEESYGIKLFTYAKKRFHLSEEGRLLLNAITTMKHDEIYLRERLLKLQNEENEIIFGCTLTASEYILPEQLCRYLKQHQNTNVKMIVANTKELLNKINVGEIDFAFVEGYFNKNEYDHFTYSKENYIAVCGNEYVFKQPIHSFEDLVNEKIIVREKGSGTRDILEKYAEEKNMNIKDFSSVAEVGNINTIKHMVMQNLGITFLYEVAIEQELKDKKLKKIELSDMNFTHDITFIYRKNSIFKQYYTDLFKQLKK